MLVLALVRMREEIIPRIGCSRPRFRRIEHPHQLAVLPTSVHLILNGLVGVTLGRRRDPDRNWPLLQYLLSARWADHTRPERVHRRYPALVAGLCHPALVRLRLAPFTRAVVAGAARSGGRANFLVLLFGGKEDWSTLATLVLLALCRSWSWKG